MAKTNVMILQKHAVSVIASKQENMLKDKWVHVDINVMLIHPPSFHYAVECNEKADCSTVPGKPECSALKTCGELVVIDFCLRILNWKRPKTRWIFKWVKNEFIFSKGFIVFTAGFFLPNLYYSKWKRYQQSSYAG